MSNLAGAGDYMTSVLVTLLVAQFFQRSGFPNATLVVTPLLMPMFLHTYAYITLVHFNTREEWRSEE